MNKRKTQKPTVALVLTCAQRKAVAELIPKLAPRLLLDAKNSRTIALSPKEAATVRRKAEDAVAGAENGTIGNTLRHIVSAVNRGSSSAEGIGAIPASERLYQFRIVLLDAKPAIWRRIQVKECTLDKLHEHIQTAMGWTNSHLHQFEIGRKRYGDPKLLDDGYGDFRAVDSTRTKLSEIVPRDGRRFRFEYEYDFGDGWRHEVQFEGCLCAENGARYPLCVEGERACPPEDVGGVWGYADFLEALADPKYAMHDDLLEWSGAFDAQKFDAGKATKAMRHGLPDWRSGEETTWHEV